MRLTKIALTSAVMLFAVLASGSALAYHHHGHASVGFYYGPMWYPYPYYYPYPPAIAVQPAPPTTYVEQGGAEPAQQQEQASWYYCAESKTYYPYVKDCAGDWQRVAPQATPDQ